MRHFSPSPLAQTWSRELDSLQWGQSARAGPTLSRQGRGSFLTFYEFINIPSLVYWWHARITPITRTCWEVTLFSTNRCLLSMIQDTRSQKSDGPHSAQQIQVVSLSWYSQREATSSESFPHQSLAKIYLARQIAPERESLRAALKRSSWS